MAISSLPIALSDLLALGSSLFFTGTLIAVRQGMQWGSPLAAVLSLNAVVSTGALLIALFRGTLLSAQWTPILWFAAMGIAGPGVGSICRIVAVERMGLSPSTLVVSTTPIWAVFLAVFVLGEQPTLPVLVGTLFIVVGVSLITLSRDRSALRFRDWFRAALIFPTVASFTYALSPIFTKLAYVHQKIPMAGLGIAFAMGSILLLIARPILPGGGILRANRRSVAWFVLGGLFNLSAAICFMTALTIGNVSSIIPITRLTPLWVVLLSPIFLRQLERFTWLLFFASLLVVSGGVLITIAGAS